MALCNAKRESGSKGMIRAGDCLGAVPGHPNALPSEASPGFRAMCHTVTLDVSHTSVAPEPWVRTPSVWAMMQASHFGVFRWPKRYPSASMRRGAGGGGGHLLCQMEQANAMISAVLNGIVVQRDRRGPAHFNARLACKPQDVIGELQLLHVLCHDARFRGVLHSAVGHDHRSGLSHREPTLALLHTDAAKTCMACG